MDFNIKKVAVLGAGTMGSSIAAHVAGAGISVILLDMVPKELTDDDINRGFTFESKRFRNKFAEFGREKVCDAKSGVIYDNRMTSLIDIGNVEDDLQQLIGCDWIIEVIIEDLDAKKDLLKKIYPYCKDSTIVSSNTSGVSITEIVEDMPLRFRKNFIGTHFFNPPRYMRLLELIPGKDTNDKVLKFMINFGTKILGKGIVVAKDTPNFIGNRIGCYSTILIIQLMEKYQLSIEEMDLLTGTIIGRPKTATFKTIDMVGLDIFYHVSNNMVRNVTNKEEKNMFTLPQSIIEMYENGQLGNKTNQGFYKKVKTEKGKNTLVWDFKIKEYVKTQDKKVEIVEIAKKEKSFKDKLCKLIYSDCKESYCAWDIIKNTLLYCANRVPEITNKYEQIDRAMNWGYNWQVSPFEIWDLIGVEKSIERMKAEGEVIPKWILDRIENGDANFYDLNNFSKGLDRHYNVIKTFDDANMLDMGDGIVCVELNTSSNSITIPFIKALQSIIKEVENNIKYKGIVLANSAINFCTGANLITFQKIISEKEWNKALESLNYFHETSMMLKYTKKPIVAAVHGMVLGGGLEFSMHCPKVIAHSETYMGLVEVGVGIIPGGGGVKEYLYRCMDMIEGFDILDLNPIIKKVWETIATAKVSKNAFEARNIGFLRTTDRIIMNIDELLDESKKEVLRMCEDGFRQSMKKKVKVSGTSGKAFLEYIIEMMKSGNMISEYDSVILSELAYVVTGGDVPKGTYLLEEELLKLETEVVDKLIRNEKTHARIYNMINTGKTLRN